jgi:hypothetical protein
MALPHVLPDPEVIVQDPAECWIAAFEIWSRANNRHLALPLASAQDDMIRWLSSGGGFLTSAGRATDSGVSLMANIGLMSLERMQSARLTLGLLDRKLNDGYVYLAYYWITAGGDRQGHAVVIYGVDANTIYYADPAPGRGLRREPAHYFTRRSVVVALGTSVLASLGRSIDESFRRHGLI